MIEPLKGFPGKVVAFACKGLTRPIFCTKASERVYITASGCEIELSGARGL